MSLHMVSTGHQYADLLNVRPFTPFANCLERQSICIKWIHQDLDKVDRRHTERPPFIRLLGRLFFRLFFRLFCRL